jgi:hypothetical protein
VEVIDSRQIERLAIVCIRAESESEKHFQQLNESINFPDEVLYAELTPGLLVHQVLAWWGMFCCILLRTYGIRRGRDCGRTPRARNPSYTC